MLVMMTAVAAACPTVNSKTISDFNNEIPAINTELQTCPITLPSNLKFLVGSGNIAVNVAMNDGTTTSFTIVVFGGQITDMNQGASKKRFSVNLDEDSANQVMASSDKTGTIISLFNQKKITTKSKNVFTSVKLAIARVGLKIFGPKPTTQAATPTTKVYPKPANCDDTYIQGHQQYQQNKATWDIYSANSDGVCQSMTTPGNCKYNVQLSTGGRPYYLCWFDE